MKFFTLKVKHYHCCFDLSESIIDGSRNRFPQIMRIMSIRKYPVDCKTQVGSTYCDNVILGVLKVLGNACGIGKSGMAILPARISIAKGAVLTASNDGASSCLE